MIGHKRKAQAAIRGTLAKKRMRVGAFPPVQKRISVPAARHTARGPELKSVDTPLQTSEVNTTAGFFLLNGVQAGTGFFNRIGNKIEMKSLEFRSAIRVNGNAPAAGNEYLRLVIIYDAQPNGALPTWADIFTSYDNAGATTSTNYSYLNINNRERFKVFADWTFSVPSANDAPLNGDVACAIKTDQEAINFHRFIKLRKLVTNYKGSTNPAAIGDIATGSLLFTFIGNRAPGAGQYNVDFSCRLRYYDS